jgi:ADP-ribose pyrophosphatase YjhB (NUDIX family)
MEKEIQGVVAGIAISVTVYTLWKYFEQRSPDGEKNAGTDEMKSDDACHSLFYGEHPGGNGSGFPYPRTIDEKVVGTLKTTLIEYTKLPTEYYKLAVERMPIVCVDVICVRAVDDKMLLFYRKNNPAANIWWWPGGRLFRGESFFDCAVRKIRDETGNKQAKVTPVGIVDVWNTFFPNSSWDANRVPGREGTQTVNITVYCILEEEGLSVDYTAKDVWAVEKHKWVTPSETLVPGMYDKYVTLNVKKAAQLGYVKL